MTKCVWICFLLFFIPAISQSDDSFEFVANEGGENHITTMHPIFGDINVRRAIAYSMDFSGSIATINHPNSPQSWAYNPALDNQEYDVAQARALLEEAGWVVDEEGVLQCEGCQYLDPYVFDSWQDESSSGLVFSLKNDLFSRKVNPNTGNFIGPRILLFNTPAGAQMVTACVDADYVAGVVYANQYFLFFNALNEGRPEGKPVFYSLGTPIISLDCGEILDDGTFPMAGIELRNTGTSQQSRPFIVTFYEGDFTVNDPSRPLAPWTITNPTIAYQQRFNTITFVNAWPDDNQQSKQQNAGIFPVGVIYGKPGPNTLTPFFQGFNASGGKRGGPKKLPLPAGIWKSYATIKPFTNTAATK
ncbi:MAG TPA: ABC transporter substrate-binding protein [Acidobacteriota bacterium]|nr:ABC transporter substrate-binding protein [Acidobacteriota bacterium]